MATQETPQQPEPLVEKNQQGPNRAEIIAVSPEAEEKIVSNVREDYQYALQAKEGLHDKWRKYESYYRNDQWSYRKVDHKRVKPTVNYVFATVESLMPYLTSNSPDPIVLPTSPDDEVLSEDMTKIAKIVMQKNGIERSLQLEERARLKFGTGIWKVYFDPTKYNGLGDVSYEVVDPVNFFIDPNCTDHVQNAGYCMTVTKRSVAYLRNKYPDRANQIVPDQQASGINVYKDQEYDPRNTQATVIEYWKKDPKQGLVRILVAGDTLLRYQPHFYAHGKYPFVTGVDYPVQKSFWGMGEAEQIITMQDVINKLLQIVIENVALANGQMLVDKTASGLKDIEGLANQLWKPGLTIPVDDVNSVKKLDGVLAPAWIINLIEMIKQDVELVTGVSPVFMGEAPGSVTAASGILALQEQATARVRLKLQEQARMLEEITQLTLAYIVEFYNEKRSFRYLEQNREPKWIQFRGSDLAENIQQDEQGNIVDMTIPEFDVTVDVGYDTPMSRAYIEQQAMQLFQMGVIDALEVLKTMNFPFKEEIMNRLRQKQSLVGQIGSLPMGMPSPALQGQLDQVTALENQNASMPSGINANNTNSKQDATQQQKEMAPSGGNGSTGGNGNNNKQSGNNA